MAKPKTRRVQRGVIVDEHWIHEWCAFGQDELTAYLERHAAFSDYLTQQEDTMHRTDPPAPAPQPNPPAPNPGPAPAPQPNPRQMLWTILIILAIIALLLFIFGRR